MDQHRRELRRAAAQAFLESLEKLQEALDPSDAQRTSSELSTGTSEPKSAPPETTKASSNPPPSPSAQNLPKPAEAVQERKSASRKQFDLADLEQAVADIEQYMQARQAKSSEPQE